MASSENEEGWLDYGSGRYKLIGCPGQDDYYLRAGGWLEVWAGTRWIAVQVHADAWGCWYFQDEDGSRMPCELVQLGMRARLIR